MTQQIKILPSSVNSTYLQAFCPPQRKVGAKGTKVTVQVRECLLDHGRYMPRIRAFGIHHSEEPWEPHRS